LAVTARDNDVTEAANTPPDASLFVGSSNPQQEKIDIDAGSPRRWQFVSHRANIPVIRDTINVGCKSASTTKETVSMSQLPRIHLRWGLAIILLMPLILLSMWDRGRSDSPIGSEEGRPELHWKDARQAVGKTAFISGFVQDVKQTKRMTFLNFTDARPPAFVVVIRRESLANLPSSPDALYRGKTVRVKGMVTTYRDQPQIVVTSPRQIEVVDSLPPRWTKSELKTGSPEAVTVATYNVLNLFDSEDDIYHADESTPAKPQAELENLAKTIHRLDADVLALQEVENRGYLERFRDVFLADMGYREIVHFEGNDERGIDVCILSRFPVGPVRSHRHVTFKDEEGRPRRFERDLLAATIEPPGGAPFELWVVHLKSNFGGREHAEPIRRAEAREVRRLLDRALSRDSKTRIVLVGDFNDQWGSETMKTIVGNGKAALSCPLEDVPAKTVTYNKPPYRSMIDFILCSPAMSRAYVSGSYQILPGTVSSSGSDHNPVTARFRAK
jgi:endonuclease/exonuclease/phosphatase family metal-dependent hydrolase